MERPQLSLHVRLADRSDLGSDNAIQGELFEFDSDYSEVGYRGVVASKVAGITYRQLDYWARKHIVEPSITPSSGSGSRRLYSFKDIVILAVAKKLLDTGVNLNNVTVALSFLLQRSTRSLEDIIILSDGINIYECTSEREMLDLMKNGCAVYGLSVGVIWHKISEALKNEESSESNSEKSQIQSTVYNIDELAERRMKRKLELQRRAMNQAQII
ncbi:MerR family transcriptional regulator [Alloscardovia theropitheci]|uniref:MerR family transcriptional regulator n=1 Tax=Alloscardovia theropitheci TaxID=2496842 RepID=A0A4R0QTL5_9BIFI|nr:MerR family transcriptional regulator [Alloscardovia theropitheci]TCD54878.1 MerR family transcriptional regulator [Alloscardovia theropitheci]